LLLEAELIKRLKPKYNFRLKDDKAFPLIKITSEKFPRVIVARHREKMGTYFGPFPQGSVRKLLRLIRRAFPFRNCSEAKFARYKNLGRGCLFYNLNLCPAPCQGKISEKDYKARINELKKFLRGRGEEVIQNLKLKMQKEAEAENFEEAMKIRNQISRLNYIRQHFKDTSARDLDINLPEDQRQEKLKELQAVLNLSKIPRRIEAYDISNISGKLATGSLVVFEDGEEKKNHYRRFKVRLSGGSDDLGMIKEILRRRFERFKRVQPSGGLNPTDKSFEKTPDLLLIDGGKGQLSAALKVIKEFGLKIPIAALAKREEEIYFAGSISPEGNSESASIKGPIKLPKDSKALQLLQRLRDESHRFALSYHRKLRSKKSFN